MSDRVDELKDKLKKLGLTNALESWEKVEQAEKELEQGQLYQKLWANVGNHLIDSGEWKQDFAENQIKSVLDEARTEFPTYAFAVGVWIARTNSPVDSGLAEAGVQKILASLREDWFIKWLGNP
jgi:hypothetical protein